MDTSALVAALVATHEHHQLARPYLAEATALPSIVLAETYAQLRRTFHQPTAAGAQLLERWTSDEARVIPTTARAVRRTFARAGELDLGGNIHDALVAEVCTEHEVGLVTLDRRQHHVALALGAESKYLLA